MAPCLSSGQLGLCLAVAGDGYKAPPPGPQLTSTTSSLAGLCPEDRQSQTGLGVHEQASWKASVC